MSTWTCKNPLKVCVLLMMVFVLLRNCVICDISEVSVHPFLKMESLGRRNGIVYVKRCIQFLAHSKHLMNGCCY